MIMFWNHEWKKIPKNSTIVIAYRDANGDVQTTVGMWQGEYNRNGFVTSSYIHDWDNDIRITESQFVAWMEIPKYEKGLGKR